MITINVTGWGQVTRKPMQIKRGVVNGLETLTRRGKRLKEANIYRPTYTTPITKGASGQPLWVRTGAWRKGQVIRNTGPYSRVIQTATVSPAFRYEPFLVKLPTSKRDGINRSNPAAERTVPQIEAIAQSTIDNAIVRAIT